MNSIAHDKYEAYAPEPEFDEAQEIDADEAGAAMYFRCMVEEAEELGEPVDWAAIDVITYNRYGDVVL